MLKCLRLTTTGFTLVIISNLPLIALAQNQELANKISEVKFNLRQSSELKCDNKTHLDLLKSNLANEYFFLIGLKKSGKDTLYTQGLREAVYVRIQQIQEFKDNCP